MPERTELAEEVEILRARVDGLVALVKRPMLELEEP